MMSFRSISASAVLMIVITMEASTAAASTATTSAVSTTLLLFLNMLESVAILITLLILVLMGLLITLSLAAVAIFAALMITVLSVLTLFSLFARWLCLVDHNLLGKLLLEIREVLVSLSVVLVLSAQKTLKRPDKFGRSLRLGLWLLILFVLLKTFEFVLGSGCTFGRGRELGNWSSLRSFGLLLSILVLVAEFGEITLVADMFRFFELRTALCEIDTILGEGLRLLLIAGESALLVFLVVLFRLCLSGSTT